VQARQVTTLFLSICLVFAVAASGCGRDEHPAQAVEGRPGRTSADQPGSVQIEMKNVHLWLTEDIGLEVKHLRGELISKPGREFPDFDDPTSYTLNVFAADVAMTTESVSALLNQRVFANEESSVEDLQVSTEGAGLKLEGQLDKGLDVPFSTTAEVSAAGGSRLRLRPMSIKAGGIPAKGILDLFDLELDELVKADKSPGIEVHEQEIILDVTKALPPPAIHATIKEVHVEPGRLVQKLGPVDERYDKQPELSMPRPDANYVFFRGQTIRFGKLTMHDTDLQLVDADLSDPFDFFMMRYQKQLIAGYSKTQPDGGLVTVMPDFADVDRQPAN
jgi:hypothetical protein